MIMIYDSFVNKKAKQLQISEKKNVQESWAKHKAN